MDDVRWQRLSSSLADGTITSDSAPTRPAFESAAATKFLKKSLNVSSKTAAVMIKMRNAKNMIAACRPVSVVPSRKSSIAMSVPFVSRGDGTRRS
ncbi:hypothetical protein C487_13637 [Natrinema pallidum DSM 3751]|uniref:Uncharacterized protein n=1 Tax=Natrinema pallidum DSM 3751 TaxID=1227495 RepID=L9YP14_9EURY|nr:hypothetical protein C487_13637 [Natrinema pallidum DSM 3751]